MATVAAETRLDANIQTRLAKLRWLIRAYVACRGLAIVVATAAVISWASLLVDWIFEPPRPARLALLAVGVLLIVWVAIRRLISPLFVPLTDASLALLLERRFAALGDRLVTAVELSGRGETRGELSTVMLANTSAEARRLSDDVQLLQVLRRQPLVVSLVLAALALVSAAGFAWWQPEAAKIWLDRSVMLGEATWPRATKIYVDEFESDENGDRIVRVARGTDLDVVARADLRDDWISPDLLEVHYENGEGSADRPPMTKRGKSIPGRDDFQEYRYQFKDLQTTTRFSVVAVRRGAMGKDDRVDNLIIEPVEPPGIDEIVLACEYPEYLGKKPAELPVTGIMSLPEGTKVVVKAHSSKALLAADWRIAGDDVEAVHTDIAVNEEDPTRMELTLGDVTENTTLLFTLRDTDGVTNQQPIRLRLLVSLDEVPAVEVRPVGVGNAVTPRANIPVVGTISDDHGLTRSWFQIEADNVDTQQVEFPLPDDGELTEESGLKLDVSQLSVVLGERFTLTVQAEDDYPLGKEPHVGKSERYEFEVITEDELRARLETKEVFLRQRLSSVADELVRVSDTLLRTRQRLVAAKEPAAETPSDDAGKEDAAADAEVEGDAAEATADAEEQSLPLNVLAVEEALQSKDRTENEVLEIAREFDSILKELVHNNVSYLEKTEERLKVGISDPLKRVVADEYPAWEQQLRASRESLSNGESAIESIDVARAQLAAILQEIEDVLLKMEDFGNFQESLARLRKIIADHRELSRLTKQRRDELKRELRKGLLD